MPFDAYLIALELIRSLRVPLQRIRQHSGPLASQLERAAASVALNLAEGRRRAKADRTHCWRIAGGSANESVACLQVGEALGYLEPATSAAALRHLDRLLAITWVLSK